MKQCKYCGKELPESCFNKYKAYGNIYISPFCNECQKNFHKVLLKNVEEIIKSN